MQYTIHRKPPAPAPVDRIEITLSPAEVTSIYGALGLTGDSALREALANDPAVSPAYVDQIDSYELYAAFEQICRAVKA